MTKQHQPKTGQPCHCKPGQQRDNCQDCEGTGQRIDFAAIRARKTKQEATARPWRSLPSQDAQEIVLPAKNGGAGKLICDCTSSPFDRPICEANAELIVRAVNEWEALNKVAEAAKYMDFSSGEHDKIHAALVALFKLRNP